MPKHPLRLGIDTGGTFTDVVVFDPTSGQMTSFKVPSTPENPAQAVLDAVRRVESENPERHLWVTHGSTVATNALLERKGAKTALITTRGFRDVLEIGRQHREGLYDLAPQKPTPLIPRELRLEVDERVNAEGARLSALQAESIQTLIAALRAEQVESVAVCLLFSFLAPDHEQIIAQTLREVGFLVSVSHEIIPEYREYERTATTVVNAYVSPVMDRYLGALETRLPDGTSLQIMQSNGGVISPAQARREAVRCILSGPAGGLVGAQYLPTGKNVPRNFLTFDMGGTSTDVALLAGEPQTTTEAIIGGMPIRVPVLDIHTIGAGGGSVAHIDTGRALRVGPQSAGADPGPACYGRRDDVFLPTVTDANLVLGRLAPDHFLGGGMPLYPDRAVQALQPLADKLGLSLQETAMGVVQIANAHMARALRLISVERGHDPRDFSLVSFGGAGGLHAVALARELAIPRVVISPYASVFSALGMLMADIVKDYTRTVMLPGTTALSALEAAAQPLIQQGRADLLAEGVAENVLGVASSLDVRYQGQSFELTVPLTENWRAAFETEHERQYGYADPAMAVEIVNVRARAVGRVPSPQILPAPLEDENPASAWLADRPVTLVRDTRPIPHYLGERLRPGNRITGPALVLRSDTTILLDENATAIVDAFGQLIIDV